MPDENIVENQKQEEKEKNNIEIDLEAKLKEEQSKSESKKQSKKDKKLVIQLEELQKKYDEQTEILKRAQNDYINLKFDLDRLQRQTQEKEKNSEVDSLISSVKKFLPFVEDLRKSLDNIPEEKKSDSLAQ
jgi:molecular chaperone GrpE (heat shock protein)